MAIYQDVGHEREFAIPIPLISRAKRRSPVFFFENSSKIRDPNAEMITRFRSNKTAIARTALQVFHIVIVVPSNLVKVNPVNASL